MNVSIIGPVFPYRAGIAYCTTRLAEELGADVISFSRQFPKRFYPGGDDVDPTLPRLERARFLLDVVNPITWMRTALLLRREKPDAVILVWWVWVWALPYLTLMALLPRTTRVILQCHNIGDKEPAAWKRMLTNAVLRRGDVLVVHAKTEAEEAARRLRVAVESCVLRVASGELPDRLRVASSELPDELPDGLRVASSELPDRLRVAGSELPDELPDRLRVAGSELPNELRVASGELPGEPEPGGSQHATRNTQQSLATRNAQLATCKLPRILQTFLPVHELGGTIPSREDARRTLGLSGNVALFFGHVRPFKGLDIALRAWRLLESDVTLVVAGEAWWKGEEEYRALAAGLTNVRFDFRFIPDAEIATYFAACDVVLAPYRIEAQSGVALTAFHFARPVIATAVGGLPEIIDEGANGMLVPPEDPAALARAIDVFFARDDRQAMERGAAESARQYSWEEYGRVFRDLVTGG